MCQKCFLIFAACLLMTIHPAHAQMSNDTCEFANDGNCDEILCPSGTDATDCGIIVIGPDPKDIEDQLNLSTRDRRRILSNLRQLDFDVPKRGSNLNVKSVRLAIRNWQRDTKHEPTGFLTRDTADVLLRKIDIVVGPNSCRYAHDEACDEPEYCARGTDTADCDIVPPIQLYCCDTNTGIRVCPAVPGIVPGQLCACMGYMGFGFVCY